MSDWRVLVLGLVLGLTLILSAVNVRLHQRNLAQLADVTERQQLINEGIQLSQFNSQFVLALATMAAGTNDAEIGQLLASHGISYTVNEPAIAQDATSAGGAADD